MFNLNPLLFYLLIKFTFFLPTNDHFPYQLISKFFYNHIVILIVIVTMGNSQNNAENQVRKLSKEINKQQPLKSDFTCPNCLIRFKAGSPLMIVDKHIIMCITNGDEPEQSRPNCNQLQKQQEQLRKSDYIFEKIQDDEKGIHFSWSRVLKKGDTMETKSLLQKPQIVRKWQFQDKLKWFRAKLQTLRISWQHGCDWITVDKNKILESSIDQVRQIDMHRQIKINFTQESVSDAGGVLREWINLITKEIFSIKPSLFDICDSDQLCYKLRYDPEIDQFTAINILGLLGTIIGKAIFEKIPLTSYLDRTVLKQLCGNSVTLPDVYSYDKGLYYCWFSLLNHTVTEDYDLYFSIFFKTSKGIEQVQLKPNGKNIAVTDDNKKQYIEKCMNQYCCKRVKKWIDIIKASLHKVIPEIYLSVFKPHQLEMIMFGVPFIDLQDWKINTEYRGAYHEKHKNIRWFWGYLQQLPQQKLSKILHFSTGSSRTPIHGFKKLEINRGNYGKFMIQSSPYNPNDPFPKGHTCFNRLELPVYPTKALTKNYIKMLTQMDTTGIYGLD